MKYDCNELDKSMCEDNRLLYVVATIFGAVVIATFYFIGRKRKDGADEVVEEIAHVKDTDQNEK